MATQILGVSCFFVTFCAVYTIGVFKRKTLMIVGQIAMTICLTATGVFAHIKNGILAVIFIIGQFYTIQLTNVFWIYLPEVLNDSQMGVVASTFYANGVLLSILQEYLLAFFGVAGLFFLFASTQFFGIFFMKFYMKETVGLTDHEKKELYYPEVHKKKPQIEIALPTL